MEQVYSRLTCNEYLSSNFVTSHQCEIFAEKHANENFLKHALLVKNKFGRHFPAIYKVGCKYLGK